jgi:hypothetical protein
VLRSHVSGQLGNSCEGPLAEDGPAPALLYRMALVSMIDSSRPSSEIFDEDGSDGQGSACKSPPHSFTVVNQPVHQAGYPQKWQLVLRGRLMAGNWQLRCW